MNGENMIKCQNCGKIINTGPNEKCPHCGETKRLLDEELHETMGLSDTVDSFFERINLTKLLINIALMFLASLLGFFFTGVLGAILGFLVGVLIFLKASPLRETNPS